MSEYFWQYSVFSKSVVDSEIGFAALCWGSGIKKVGSVLGTALIVKRKILHKLMNIKNNTDHPLHNIVMKDNNLKVGDSITTLTAQKTGELTAGGVAFHLLVTAEVPLSKAPYPHGPRAL